MKKSLPFPKLPLLVLACLLTCLCVLAGIVISPGSQASTSSLAIKKQSVGQSELGSAIIPLPRPEPDLSIGDSLGKKVKRFYRAKLAKIIEPTKNGKCSDFGWPKDKDCPKPPPPKFPVPAETIRFVSSNIKVSDPVPSFQRDYGKLVAARPDFMVLQEQGFRNNELYEVDNYRILRNQQNLIFTSTPVVWDSSRWDLLESGSRMLSYRKKNSLPKANWGDRAVNWGVFRSKTTGRVVSVISCHSSPTIRSTEGLLPIYVSNLAKLVEELSARGEVMFGGDLNMHYRGGQFASSKIATYPFINTFDVFGKIVSHDGGGTIDYMYAKNTSLLTPTVQGQWDQESDHDALWSEWSLSSPAGEQTQAVIDAMVLKPAQGIIPPK